MSASTSMTGARHIAEMLKGYGVTHIFYVDAILRKTMVDLEELGIRRVITHSEKAAAYMADGYARVSGRVGVCMAQSVGAANLASGLQDAYLGLAPVIALTGKKPPLFQQRNAYQEIDHGPMFAPVTKYRADVTTAAQLPFQLRQAFREATSGAPGPVHLDLLGHTGRPLELADITQPVVVDESFVRYPAFRPQPNADDIKRAAHTIASARHPVIVAGGGVRLSGAGAALIALAEQLQIPVATSVNAKGMIPERHPLCVGVVGSYSARCANQVVAEADLVIYVGSHTGDQVTHNWAVPALGTRVVQVDIDPSEIGRSYAGAVGVVGDARMALEQLAAAVPRSTADSAWLGRAQSLVAAWRAEIAPLRDSDALPIRPERLCRELSDLLPADAVLVADTGYASIWTATMVAIEHPTQTYLRAAGSLGWAFPAALGVKCAAPDRPVVCFTGDGGFWYHMAELETARRHTIRTVTVINNNRALAQGIDDIHAMYAGRLGNPAELYQFAPVSFARIAEEIGCLGIQVEHPSEIAPAITRALAANVPAVVEVITGAQYRAPEPWMPPQ